MKSLITLICLALAVSVSAQSSPLAFQESVSIQNTTRAEMFLAARKWVVQAFPDSKFIVEDKASGDLSAKSETVVALTYTHIMRKHRNWKARFNANFRFADNQYQYEFTNIEVQKGPGAKYYKLWADRKDDHYLEAMKRGAETKFREAALSLKTTLDNLN